MKVVIIGGVAGGATAAARLRRLDENAEIVILERSGFVSYANCGLPYYIGGVIKKRSKLTLQTPQSFKRRFNIDVRVQNEVVGIDRASKIVSVKNLGNGNVYNESYDKLILSPGAKAVIPEWEGATGKNVFTLRTVENTFDIDNFISTQNPSKAVVVGGGFIGLEMAENLMHKGIEVTLIQRSGQIMPPLDFDTACTLNAYAKTKGLDIRYYTQIVKVEDGEGKKTVYLSDGSKLESDFVVLAIGVQPDTHLAKEAGLALGIKDSILVNPFMQTSDPDIYAVGDAVQVKNIVTGEDALIPLAGPANRQGRIAADNIAGLVSEYKGSQGSSVMKFFDVTVASTGINEKTAQKANIDYGKVVQSSASHATYYPGAKDILLKVLYDNKDGRILGAQAIGQDGVEKRMDVLATAIRAKMTADDLAELDLCYAPPYSSAKDPVNMAGYVIQNILSGAVKQHHWHDVKDLVGKDNIILLDVRTKEEFDEGHFEGAVNIPVDELRNRTDELDKSKRIYVNCYSGLRSYVACRMLAGKGFDCSNLSGGYMFFDSVAGGGKYDDRARYACGIVVR